MVGGISWGVLAMEGERRGIAAISQQEKRRGISNPDLSIVAFAFEPKYLDGAFCTHDVGGCEPRRQYMYAGTGHGQPDTVLSRPYAAISHIDAAISHRYVAISHTDAAWDI